MVNRLVLHVENKTMINAVARPGQHLKLIRKAISGRNSYFAISFSQFMCKRFSDGIPESWYVQLLTSSVPAYTHQAKLRPQTSKALGRGGFAFYRASPVCGLGGGTQSQRSKSNNSTATFISNVLHSSYTHFTILQLNTFLVWQEVVPEGSFRFLNYYLI